MGKFEISIQSLDAIHGLAAQQDTSKTLLHALPKTALPPRDYNSSQQPLGDFKELFIGNETKVAHDLNIPSIETKQSSPNAQEQAEADNEDDREDEYDNDQRTDPEDEESLDHIITVNSYGKLRFVGGLSTMVMVEALHSLNPSEASSPLEMHASPRSKSVSVLELPWFSRGKTFPKLLHLPNPKDLPRPPRYVSDLLVNIYFKQLHYAFPILYKPHFMQRYSLLVHSHQ